MKFLKGVRIVAAIFAANPAMSNIAELGEPGVLRAIAASAVEKHVKLPK